MSSSDEPEPTVAGDGQVTALELFFDLVFVFGFTQVTGFLSTNLTWPGMVRGAALFAALWWAWAAYAWLTGAVRAEDRLPARLVVLSAMVAMLVVALAVPNAFGADAVLFGTAYFVVRLLHQVLYAVAGPPQTRAAVWRTAPGALGGPALLVFAGFFDGPVEAGLWVVALLVDYGVFYVRGVEGFAVNPAHFVERHRLVLIIALGESIVALGVGAQGIPLTPPVLLAAGLGILLVIAVWWLYFDYVALAAEQRLAREDGSAQAVLARDSYSYLHLFIVGSVIFVALGVEQTLAHVDEPLSVTAAAALLGGGAIYLLGHNAFRYRNYRTLGRARLVAAAVALLSLPVAVRVPAIGTLAGLAVLLVAVAAYETQRSQHRAHFRP